MSRLKALHRAVMEETNRPDMQCPMYREAVDTLSGAFLDELSLVYMSGFNDVIYRLGTTYIWVRGILMQGRKQAVDSCYTDALQYMEAYISTIHTYIDKGKLNKIPHLYPRVSTTGAFDRDKAGCSYKEGVHFERIPQILRPIGFARSKSDIGNDDKITYFRYNYMHCSPQRYDYKDHSIEEEFCQRFGCTACMGEDTNGEPTGYGCAEQVRWLSKFEEWYTMRSNILKECNYKSLKYLDIVMEIMESLSENLIDETSEFPLEEEDD